MKPPITANQAVSHPFVTTSHKVFVKMVFDRDAEIVTLKAERDALKAELGDLPASQAAKLLEIVSLKAAAMLALEALKFALILEEDERYAVIKALRKALK